MSAKMGMGLGTEWEYFEREQENKHCVKSVRIRSYSGPHFAAFRLNRRDTEYLSAFSPNAGKYGPE